MIYTAKEICDTNNKTSIKSVDDSDRNVVSNDVDRNAIVSNNEKHRYFKCCICGKLCEGYGNNPAPIKLKGECCDECNTTKVIPARLNSMKIQDDKCSLAKVEYDPFSGKKIKDSIVMHGTEKECNAKIAELEKAANDSCIDKIIKVELRRNWND